ncbi:MAG: hypothetical protein JRI45_05080 [Deltaproteobacteria bacterium]|nr:hypothetical protein [Deltaproteobacteria bacterium]MBW2068423.1 hypothetical protein [Deltaproteobacteria bacterium]
MSEEKFTLYPSNWLYNAGVIGLLRVLETGGENVTDFLSQNGVLELSSSIFDKIKYGKVEIPKVIKYLVDYEVSEEELKDWKNETTGKGSSKETNADKYRDFYERFGRSDFGYKFVRAGNKLFASKTPFQNLVQFSEWQSFEYPGLVANIPKLIAVSEGEKCDLCFCYPVIIKDPKSKLQVRLTQLQSTHLKELGSSPEKFPNGFWNMNHSMRICFLCSFLIIHHRFAFVQLSDGSEIFINAPSFQVMWHLNKFAVGLLGTSSSKKTLNKRNILAMSVIEYATKVQTTLGAWTGMNIEVVSRHRDQVEFSSMPYDVIQLLSDRRIAEILSRIGEFTILNLVLDRDFSRLMEMGYRLLRIGLKPHNERNNNYIKYVLKLDKNQKNPTRVADRIFKLCTIIEEKRKRREAYGHRHRFARS